MKRNSEISPFAVKNVRIRFNQEQLDLVRRAAKLHGMSVNSFVIWVCEDAAAILVNIPPVESRKVISSAVRQALTER